MHFGAKHSVNKNDKNLLRLKRKIDWCKKLLLHEEFAHRVEVTLVDDAHVSEVSLTLFALLGQDVTLVSMFSFNLPCSGKGESFFGTGISFNFWHFVVV